MDKPRPHEFQNRHEIVAALKEKRPFFDLWFNRPNIKDLREVVRESVAGNTFRTFAHLPHQPSVIFRNWAESEFRQPENLNSVLATNSQDKYDTWIRDLSEKLSRHWVQVMGIHISYGASRKLTNLLAKQLILWQGLTNNARESLKRMAHVPFDKYSLVGIRKCVNWVSIPPKPSMSFVATETLYNKLQQFIRHVTAEAQVPTIYFDILTWNIAHGK